MQKLVVKVLWSWFRNKIRFRWKCRSTTIFLSLIYKWGLRWTRSKFKFIPKQRPGRKHAALQYWQQMGWYIVRHLAVTIIGMDPRPSMKEFWSQNPQQVNVMVEWYDSMKNIWTSSQYCDSCTCPWCCRTSKIKPFVNQVLKSCLLPEWECFNWQDGDWVEGLLQT